MVIFMVLVKLDIGGPRKKNEYEYWNRGLFDEVVIRNSVYWEQSFSVRCIKN